MADVIHLNYLLLNILSRFNITLGFGDKTVEEVCGEHKVNVEFFLEITNSYHDENYFPKKQLQGFPVHLIVNYLKKTHDYYLDKKIPEIAELILRLTTQFPPSTLPGIDLLNRFFIDYKEELTRHIQREDDSIMPYILEVEQAFNSKKLSGMLFEKIKAEFIEKFALEHDNVEDKLYDLKNIIIKYLPPIEDQDLCNQIFIELSRLERDLNNHARIEDKVLIPMVMHMERKLLEQGAYRK
ncbi:MAG: hemerythrin domain-containing protein [Bacteroidales bacterium]|nr:hemerythrin domain-containing protein [Bacteroidales bacterium]